MGFLGCVVFSLAVTCNRELVRFIGFLRVLMRFSGVLWCAVPNMTVVWNTWTIVICCHTVQNVSNFPGRRTKKGHDRRSTLSWFNGSGMSNTKTERRQGI